MIRPEDVPDDNSHLHIPGVDMSPEAISRRWEEMSQLYILMQTLQDNDFLKTLPPETREKLKRL